MHLICIDTPRYTQNPCRDQPRPLISVSFACVHIFLHLICIRPPLFPPKPSQRPSLASHLHRHAPTPPGSLQRPATPASLASLLHKYRPLKIQIDQSGHSSTNPHWLPWVAPPTAAILGVWPFNQGPSCWRRLGAILGAWPRCCQPSWGRGQGVIGHLGGVVSAPFWGHDLCVVGHLGGVALTSFRGVVCALSAILGVWSWCCRPSCGRGLSIIQGRGQGAVGHLGGRGQPQEATSSSPMEKVPVSSPGRSPRQREPPGSG